MMTNGNDGKENPAATEVASGADDGDHATGRMIKGKLIPASGRRPGLDEALALSAAYASAWIAGLKATPNDDLGRKEWDFICKRTCMETGGSDAGLAAFDDWSKKSSKYDAAKTRQRWDHYAQIQLSISADDIERLNAVHAVLPISGKVRVVTFGELEEFPGRTTITMTQTLEDFVNLKNKYRHAFVDDDGKQKTIPMGTYWRNSHRRRQYDGGMAFMPRHDEEVIGNKLNLWGGYGVHSIKGDCGLFLDFMLDVICSGDKEHFDYLEKREAFILQKRKRSEIALALHSKEEGVGKGFYERHVGHLYGNHAMQVSNPTHVIGKHNPHLEVLLRLTADEALFVGDPRHRNALFGLITEPKVTIEPKFIGPYNADNFLNISITTNSEHFIPVSGTARRFFVPTVSPCHMQDFSYFRAIDEQLRNGGYEALLFHLLRVDLSEFNVRMVPKTAGLAEQAAYSRKGVDLLVEAACNEAQVPCASIDFLDVSVTSNNEPGSFDYFIDHHPDRELARLGALAVKHRLRKEWGCQTGQRKQKGDARVSGIQWPPLAELRERFVAKHGEKQWLDADATEWLKGGGF